MSYSKFKKYKDLEPLGLDIRIKTLDLPIVNY